MKKIFGLLLIGICLFSQVEAKDYLVDRVLDTGNLEDSLYDVAFNSKSDQIAAGGSGRVIHFWDLAKDTHLVSQPPSKTVGKVSKNDNDPIIRIVFSNDNLYVVALYERYGPNAFAPMLPERPLIPKVGNKTNRSALWYDMLNEKTYTSNIAEISNGSVGPVMAGWNVFKKGRIHQYGGWRLTLNNNGKIRGLDKGIKTKVSEEGGFQRIVATPTWVAVTKKQAKETDSAPNLKVISQKTGELMWEKRITQSTSNNLELSEGAEFLFIGTPGAILILDSLTGEEKGRLVSGDYQTGRMSLSPDKKTLAVAGEGKVLIWDWEKINAELR